MKKTSLQDRQTFDELVNDIWVGIGDIHAKGREVTNKDLDDIRDKFKQKLKQSLLANMPEKLDKVPSVDIRHDLRYGYNQAIDECIKVIEKEL